jgi:RHH-type proline utilization regulon transcriptional repressor/proline dehydrogenase/delta 1-pyrroline-5-carboxylate dehydrogenase
LAEKNGVSDYVTFEMLEGMANNLPRVMRKLQKHIILYTPVVRSNHFLNAISYLVRRLDENTGKDNFLSYSFNLMLDSKQWNFLIAQFLKAYKLKDSVRTTPYRTQDRTKPTAPTSIKTFNNEPDTNLDLPQNRRWALDALKKWESKVITIPVQTGDKEVLTDNKKLYYDRSRNMDVCVCEANLATPEQVREIIDIAEQDASEWRSTTLEYRNILLHKIADMIADKRGDLVGCMAAVTGKTFAEGDVEVSEAIDFCRFYPVSMKAFEALPTVEIKPKGVILVIPPWNFPLAIPVGGVASALAGGNSVILKPATVALPVAYEFARCFWDAGVPRDALQVVCPADRSSLAYLAAHPAIKHIILTGGTDTALRLLKNSPRTPLSAETGGKNAIIVTDSADQDHAILNIVASAFGNAGQKCSACSLLLLDKTIYNDEAFKSKLRDAVKSIRTGSVWDAMNTVGPMIDNDNEKLKHAVETLEQGEEWLVEPEFVDDKKYILKPTVKWGVRPGSYTFRTELFAPLLAVVRIDNLKQGIKYANSSEYGLTAGLQSLNEDEHCLWRRTIEAGNLYINRGITGAIVSRQPFGGMKRSAFGGGVKAGGPNYVSCFVDIKEKDSDRFVSIDAGHSQFSILNSQLLAKAKASYRQAYEDVFAKSEDISNIYGEENLFRYLPLKSMVLRVAGKDDLTEVKMIVEAAGVAKTPITISVSKDYAALSEINKDASASTNANVKVNIIVQDEAAFIAKMHSYERVRACSADSLSDAVYAAAAAAGLYIADRPPLTEGRLELLHYLKEQSISCEYHRYGSIFDDN